MEFSDFTLCLSWLGFSAFRNTTNLFSLIHVFCFIVIIACCLVYRFSNLLELNYAQRFRKIDSDRWEFANEGFQQGKKHLLKFITRRKQNLQTSQKQSWLDSTKHGAEAELENLKNNQDSLQTEVFKLRQQQEMTQSYLAAVEKRLRISEMKQRQTAFFLIKFMKNPQLLQCITEKMNKIRALSNGEIISKKRRFTASSDVEDESLMAAMKTVDIDEVEKLAFDDKKIQLHEKLASIQSDIETLLSTDESHADEQNAPSSSEGHSSENFVLWEKLLEDDMIYEDDTKQESDMITETENVGLNPSPPECGTQIRGLVGCLASIA